MTVKAIDNRRLLRPSALQAGAVRNIVGRRSSGGSISSIKRREGVQEDMLAAVEI
jgi:hypothetical protein